MHNTLTRLATFVLFFSVVLAANETETATTESTGIDGYIPKKGMSYVGIGAFGLSALFQAVQWVRCGGHRYMIPLVLGMFLMAGGFGVRVIYADKIDSLMVYIATTMLILLSPCLYLAQDYMLLHHLADALGQDVAKECLFLRSSLITKLFVASDVFTFLLQAGGGGMSAGSPDMAKIGQKVALVGLFIQLICFLGYCTLLSVFIYRVRSRYPHLRYPSNPFQFKRFSMFSTTPIHDWRPLAAVVSITTVGIIVRSIFRLIEYAQGHDGALKTTETWFYLLDALPLWICMTLFCVIWPPRVIDGVEAGDASEALPVISRRSPWQRVHGEDVGMQKLPSGGSYSY